MIQQLKKRRAFTMLELIFVIIILGIVSSIGAEIIANVYESYITQRSQHRSSIKTQLTLNQIANRLRYAIPGTIVRRVSTVGAAEELSTGMASGADAYTVLQWVAYDGDSFEAMTSTSRKPGWSGFCDIDAAVSPVSVLSTPGSNFTLTNTIQTNLGNTTGKFAIYFPGDFNGAGNPIAHFGSGAVDTITLDNNVTRIVERYKLAWTSYALSVEGGDLYLYSNFSPTFGAAIGGTRSLLLKNVTNFKFEGRGQTTRVKICVEEFLDSNVSGTGIASCKEKAVF